MARKKGTFELVLVLVGLMVFLQISGARLVEKLPARYTAWAREPTIKEMADSAQAFIDDSIKAAQDSEIKQSPADMARPPLMEAIYWRDTALVRALISVKKGINVSGSEGETPLTLAMRMGDFDTFVRLLEAKADFRAKTSSGQTPLGIALAKNDYHMTRILLLYGAKLDEVVGANGITGLILAQASNNEKIRALAKKPKPKKRASASN